MAHTIITGKISEENYELFLEMDAYGTRNLIHPTFLLRQGFRRDKSFGPSPSSRRQVCRAGIYLL